MERNLLRQLQNGGYILYARHGEATVGVDRPNLDFGNCDTQRNLSELGKMQAVYYGNTLRQLRIPIGTPIVASPYCRAVETAQLAFMGAGIQVDPLLASINDLAGMSPQAQAAIMRGLKTRLEVMPPPGYNQSIIAHSFPDGIGLGRIPYMGTVVVRPLGPGNGYDIVARLSLDDLARPAGSPG